MADEHDGKLPNRVVFFCDELGTMPAFDILPLFSAGRSRRLTLVPIIQSIAQLDEELQQGRGRNSIRTIARTPSSAALPPNSPDPPRCSPKALGSRHRHERLHLQGEERYQPELTDD